MFGSIVEGFSRAKTTTEVHRLLVRNYALNADLDELGGFVAQNYGDDKLKNPHDLAILYLCDKIWEFDKSNPDHIKLATKFVRVAKQAFQVGAAQEKLVLRELERVISQQLGINTSAIGASSI